jgi:hypothetical protein
MISEPDATPKPVAMILLSCAVSTTPDQIWRGNPPDQIVAAR